MNNNEVWKHVLYVGFDCKKPKGGIGSVLNTYSSFISPFKFVRTSGGDLSLLNKLIYAFQGLIKLIYLLCVDRDIKIVHIHSASGVSFWRKSILIVISRLFRKKIIFHCHGGGFQKFRDNNKSIVDFFLRKCDVIIALSDYWKDYFRTISQKKVFVIKNVIASPNLFEVPSDNKFHFLFLGLICKNKGIYDLLDMISIHKEDLKGKVCFHIGGNGETEILKQIIKNKNIEDLVSFEGWVDKNKRDYLFNLSNAFILPSYVEGVPISLLEAESFQKAVITTNVGGIPSIVKDGFNGFMIAPGDKEALYNSVKWLIENPEKNKEFGVNGSSICKDYLPNNVKSQLESVYNMILD